MTLQQFLTSSAIKPAAFAAQIDVAPSTITRILRGERSPTLEIMAKIKAGTDGKVTADDWLAEWEAAE